MREKETEGRERESLVTHRLTEFDISSSKEAVCTLPSHGRHHNHRPLYEHREDDKGTRGEEECTTETWRETDH